MIKILKPLFNIKKQKRVIFIKRCSAIAPPSSTSYSSSTLHVATLLQPSSTFLPRQLAVAMATTSLHVRSPVVVVSSSGASSGCAERCLMHLKRMQSVPLDCADVALNRIVVQHDDAHAIIVLHVDSSSCTPIVGGGIALDSLHCAAQVGQLGCSRDSVAFFRFLLDSHIVMCSTCSCRYYIAQLCKKVSPASHTSPSWSQACTRACLLTVPK
jgi:hypothetical protein